jgi:PIN domain nuclease of toxin-antitoxin system
VPYLLDTHTFLWFLGGDEQLPQTARQLIEDMDNEVLLSTVSLWEIAIKSSLGKLTLVEPFDKLIPREMMANEIQLLPISISALSQLTTLPFHHRDPFDRLIIAQAMTENLTVIGKDPAFSQYAVGLIWEDEHEAGS